MSNRIDDRIVQMQFDNQKFEKNIAQSQKSLEKLDKSLKFQNTNKLDELVEYIKKIDFSGIERGVQNLENRFSAFGIATMAVITRITNAAIDLGKRLANMSIGQAISGGKKRAFAIEQARFSLQGLLQDVDKVDRVMNIALKSVDGTAYAFDDAAKAASNFVATGLNDAQLTKALKATADVTAVVNGNYESMAHLMTSIAGNGRLMGINLQSFSSQGLNVAAQMSKWMNEVKSGQVKDVPDAIKKQINSIIKAYGKGGKLSEQQFRDAVSKGKISFDLVSEAFSTMFGEHAKSANETFTGALANMKAALSRTGAAFFTPLVKQGGPLVKMFNAIRITINALNKTLDPFVKAVEGAVSSFANWVAKIADVDKGEALLHIADLMEGFANILEIAKIALNQFKKAFSKSLFGQDKQSGIDKFNTFAENFKNFTQYLKGISQTFRGTSIFGKDFVDGFTGVADLIFKIKADIKTVFKELKNLFGPSVKRLGEALLTLFGSVGRFVSTFVRASKAAGFFESIIRSLGKILNSILRPAIELVSKGIEKFSKKLDENNNFGKLTKTLAEIAVKFEEFADAVSNKVFGTAFEIINGGLEALNNMLHPVNDTLEETANKVSPLAVITDTIAAGLTKVWNVIKSIGNGIAKFFKDAFNFSVEETGGVFSLAAIIEMVYYFYKRFKAMTKQMSMFGTFWYELEKIPGRLIDIVEQFRVALVNIQKSTGGKVRELKRWATVGLMIAAALFILGAALKLIASADPVAVGASLVVLAAGLTGYIAAMQYMQKTMDAKKAKGVKKMTSAMIIMSVAMLVLAMALKKLSQIDIPHLIVGTLALSVLMGVLTACIKSLSNTQTNKGIKKSATAMILMSIAVNILAGAMTKIAKLEWEEIAKGLVGVGGLLLGLALFAKLMGDSKLKTRNLAGVWTLALSLDLMAGTLTKLSSLSWEEIGKGLAAVGGLLLGIGLASRLMSKKGMIGAGVGILFVSLALKALVKPIGTLGKMSLPTLAKGIGGLIVPLVAIGLLLKNMAKQKGLVAASAALLITSLALKSFTKTLKLLSAIPFMTLINGVSNLVLAAVGLRLVGEIAGPVSGSLLVLSAAVAVFGLGIAALATGLIQLGAGAGVVGAGLNAFASSLVAIVPTVVEAIAKGILQLVVILAENIPIIVDAVAKILIACAEAIITAGPALIEAITTVLVALLVSAHAILITAIDLVVDVILKILEAAEKLVPQIVKTTINIIVAILDTLAEGIPRIIDSGIKLVIALINGIADGIRNNNKEFWKAGLNILTAIIEGFVNAVKNIVGIVKEVGGKIVNFVKDGLGDKIDVIKDWVTDLPKKLLDWIKGKADAVKEVGANIMDGIGKGITGALSDLKKKVTSVVDSVVGWWKDKLGIHSPSRVMAEMGKYMDQGLVVGMENYSGAVKKASEAVGDGAIEGMMNALDGANALDFGTDFTDPVIKPVLDLSEIQNGSNLIGNLLNGDYTTGLGFSNLSGNVGSNTYNSTFNVTVNAAEGQDVNAIADAVSRRINEDIMSKGMVWA